MDPNLQLMRVLLQCLHLPEKGPDLTAAVRRLVTIYYLLHVSGSSPCSRAVLLGQVAQLLRQSPLPAKYVHSLTITLLL